MLNAEPSDHRDHFEPTTTAASTTQGTTYQPAGRPIMAIQLHTIPPGQEIPCGQSPGRDGAGLRLHRATHRGKDRAGMGHESRGRG